MALKKWSKYFIFFFLASYLIINWNETSWIFNYRAVSGIIAGFFQNDYSEGKTIKEGNGLLKKEEKKESQRPWTEKNNILEIPKLDISAPLIFPKKENDVQKSLNRGVVHFPNSALPGDKGETIILGHSAPPGWPKIKYDWVFTQINQLKKGDEIFVYFNHQRYVYYVKEKFFLNRGENLPNLLTSSKNMLMLISCWPPGKDIKRIAVAAEQ